MTKNLSLYDLMMFIKVHLDSEFSFMKWMLDSSTTNTTRYIVGTYPENLLAKQSSGHVPKKIMFHYVDGHIEMKTTNYTYGFTVSIADPDFMAKIMNEVVNTMYMQLRVIEQEHKDILEIIHNVRYQVKGVSSRYSNMGFESKNKGKENESSGDPQKSQR